MGIKLQTHKQETPATKNSKLQELLNTEIRLFGSGFSEKKKEAFYAELSILLKSGINLKKALELIARTQKKKKDQQLIEGISSRIVAGDSLSQVLEEHTYFSAYEYRAVRIGEQTGKLFDVTNDLFEFYRQKNEQKRQVYAALSYPIIVLATAAVVVFVMMRFVVPMFVDIFRQNQVELPWITQKIVDASNFVTSYGWMLLLLGMAFPFVFRQLGKKMWYKKPMDRIKLRMPVMGSYIKKVYLTQFTQAMALLTGARIPVVTGVSLVRDMIPFYPLQDSLASIEKDLVGGSRLSESFAKHRLYDKKMIALLQVAEETNQTEFVFEKLYEQYRSDLKYRSQMITAVLNPIFIFVVAFIVGVILIAMYLPMFKLSSVIG